MGAFDSLRGEKYVDLVTFRKTGAGVHTPVWFAEEDGRLYVMTRSDSGKFKRLRNNPQVEIAPCTMRGRRTGPALAARARPAEDQGRARQAIRRKYLLARFPIWSRKNIYLELFPA